MTTVLGSAEAQQVGDILITGGRIVDGTGAPERAADVLVRGDRIVFIGDAAAAHVTAKRTLQAKGMVVAPGFIDPHTHTFEDLSSTDAARRRNAAYLAQGVTTVLTGNDGGGPTDVGASLAQWTRTGIGTNAALYVGFGSVRQALLGMSSAPATPEQTAKMRDIVRAAMAHGAVGMSAGLYYAPQSYASTEEVISVARDVGPMGGVYDTHLRDESSYSIGLLGAIGEAIRIGRETNTPVNISHIKALGVDVWGKSDSAIAMVRAARSAGQRVTADQYPYDASGSSVGASLLPRWAEAGGRDSLRKRLTDGATRARISSEMSENLRRRGGAASLLITDHDARGYGGKRLNEIATARGVSPLDAAIEIILSGDASVASFNMNAEDIARFMTADFTMTGSDGSDGHPRKYGTFPKKYREYVRSRGLLTLAEFMHRSSQMPAEVFGLKQRGILAEGAFADILVFDPAKFSDQSTYEAPTRLAVGADYVLVNGRLAVDGGRVTDLLAGRALARERTP
ncbi:MAG: amidohydrolase family protein [Gemmatimonadaceae bacterium]